MSQEQNPSSPQQAPSFIEPYDVKRNDIGAEELQTVHTKFENLFSDVQLGQVEGTRSASGFLGTSTTLLKRSDDIDPTVEWSLLVHAVPAGEAQAEQFEIEPEDAVIKHLSISRKDGVTDQDPIGNPRETFIYTLGLDGIVRRKDRGDLAAEKEQMEARQEEAVISDQELQVLSGQNDQPISLVEMDGLEEFVRQSGWKPPQSLVLGIKALQSHRD
jgi:hypothetical protein